MTKVWKSEKILMRFLDSPPWADRSKGLEFTGILLTSFVNIDNKWANCSYLNDIEWQKSENPKILMRFLDSPPWANRSKGLEFTGILLISFFFVRNLTSFLDEFLLPFVLELSWFVDRGHYIIADSYRGRRFHWFFGTWLQIGTT